MATRYQTVTDNAPGVRGKRILEGGGGTLPYRWSEWRAEASGVCRWEGRALDVQGAILRGVRRLDESQGVARHCRNAERRESRSGLSSARPTRSTREEGSRTGTSQLAVATKEPWLAERAEVRTIDSDQFAATSGGFMR